MGEETQYSPPTIAHLEGSMGPHQPSSGRRRVGRDRTSVGHTLPLASGSLSLHLSTKTLKLPEDPVMRFSSVAQEKS